MSIFDFFTREAGQERRRALDDFITQFIPPEIRPQLGLLAEANPVVSMERAGKDAQALFAPDQGIMDRLAAGGRIASNMAGVVAPAAVAGRAGVPAATAVMEGLLGGSPAQQAAADMARGFVVDESGALRLSPSGPDLEPFANMTREEFIGSPRITGPSNASSLKPKALRGLEDVEAVDFPVGNLKARYDDGAAAVYDGDKVVASYNFGDTLVVDPKYRRKGIGEELVYQWRTRFPAPAATKTRTSISQRIQENVWERIQRELGQAQANAPGLLSLPQEDQY